MFLIVPIGPECSSFLFDYDVLKQVSINSLKEEREDTTVKVEVGSCRGGIRDTGLIKWYESTMESFGVRNGEINC